MKPQYITDNQMIASIPGLRMAVKRDIGETHDTPIHYIWIYYKGCETHIKYDNAAERDATWEKLRAAMEPTGGGEG